MTSPGPPAITALRWVGALSSAPEAPPHWDYPPELTEIHVVDPAPQVELPAAQWGQPDTRDVTPRSPPPSPPMRRPRSLPPAPGSGPLSVDPARMNIPRDVLGDFIGDTNAILPIDAAIQSNLRETTTRTLALLTAREERVLRMRFGIGINKDHTLEEVGQRFSVTRERIRQIEAKALRKLKHPSRSRILRSFLHD